jgi:hypothetical protein
MVFTRQTEQDESATLGEENVARPRTGVWRSGWWPAALVFIAGAVLLRYYDVSLVTYFTFAAYIGLGITLPGLLLWRLVHRGSRTFAEDAAAGTAIGYAIEVLSYIPARAIGFPLLSQAVPVLVVAAFLAVPKLRRYWRGTGAAGRAPVLYSWTIAAIAGILLAWGTKYYRYHGMSWPSYGHPDIDLTFHLALIGEVKHHMDLVTPWVTSEPIYYHWFVYADIASTSWATGIEPYVLITRLSMLPMILAFAVLVASFGRRVAGSWWGGAVTAIATFFVLAPNPFGWVLDGFYHDFAFNTIDDGSNFRMVLWTSPTQTFGSLLFVPLMLVLLDLLRNEGGDKRRWLLFALLPAGIMGAKATFLPTLVCGLLLVVAAQLVFKRKLNRVALKALGIVLFWMLFAQFILFGGQSQGLGFGPLEAMRRNPMGDSTNYTDDPKLYRLVILLGLTVLCWIFIWGGIAALRRRLFDAEVLVMLGLGIAGAAVLVLFGHSGGQAEGFFLQGARPYLAAAATWGLALLLPGLTWRKARPVLVAVLAGTAAVFVIRMIDGPWKPLISVRHRAGAITIALVWPYATLLFLTVAVAAVLWWFRKRLAAGLPAALVVALMLGFTLPTAFSQVKYMVTDAQDFGWKDRTDLWPVVTKGTLEAGRWLREHSSPDDLVATNVHCAYLGRRGIGACDRRHFGISAYSERRVLVESWAYTAESHNEELVQGLPQEHTRYWYPQILADNDAAFKQPSAETIRVLRDKYHVKWLFTEDDITQPSDDLPKFAKLVFESGYCAVYQIA